MITGASGVFAGRVINVWDHPNADRLRVAEVECRGDKLQVVFGGRLDAVETDSVVPIAPPGARVPTRRRKLRKVRFRGVESTGMLCSLTELGWTTECPDEVAVLKNVQPGARLDGIGAAERREVAVLESPDSVSWA